MRTRIRSGQKRSEALMEDVCIIKRVSRTSNEDYTIETEETLIYGGPDCHWNGRCKVQTYEPDAIDRVSAGRPVVTQEYRLHVPVGAGPFEIGDVAEVEGYPQPFRIDGLIKKTFQTAQRLRVTAQANAKGK